MTYKPHSPNHFDQHLGQRHFEAADENLAQRIIDASADMPQRKTTARPIAASSTAHSSKPIRTIWAFSALAASVAVALILAIAPQQAPAPSSQIAATQSDSISDAEHFAELFTYPEDGLFDDVI